MRLLIMSAEKQVEVNRVIEEARALGHFAESKKPSEIDAGQLQTYSHLLIRAMSGETEKAREIAKKALASGLKVVDEKIALGLGKNKYQNYLLFKKNGLFVPRTLVFSKKSIERAEAFEGNEVVVKSAYGKRGRDIYKVKKNSLAKLVEKIDGPEKYILQEFVPIERELRVLVIGKKVLGAFYKETGDWKHNVALGAKAKQVDVTEEVRETALKAVGIVETEIAGVDIAFTKRGLFVLEVNRSPGFNGFEEATGINVAKEIVGYLENK